MKERTSSLWSSSSSFTRASFSASAARTTIMFAFGLPSPSSMTMASSEGFRPASSA